MTIADLRIEKGKQTRTAILMAAFQLLTEEGPKGLTAGKLAEKAGMSKANLFHHFKSMDDVPLAVLDELCGQFAAKMSNKKAKTASEYVYQIGNALIDAPAERKKVTAAFVHFYIRSAHDESFRAQQEKMTLQFLQTLQKGLQEVLGRSLTTKEKDVVPLLVATSLEGMGFLTITLQDKERFKKTWKALSEFIGNFLGEGEKA